MSHNVYLVLVRRFDHCHVLRHAVLVLLWLELESLQAWRLEDCRRLYAVNFFVSAATSKKLKTNDSKEEIIYSPLRHQSMKAWRDPSQKLSVTAMSRMTNFAMVQKCDLKEEFAGNFAKQQRWLNNPTLNSVTLRIWEEFQKRREKKSSEQLACWKSLLKILTLNDRTYRTSKYP